ncbi:MAG: diguanylate cyclase [Planctomycetes bacterium]|nr:diguanylate cyclase [Planctomycetota bacterium]
MAKKSTIAILESEGELFAALQPELPALNCEEKQFQTVADLIDQILRDPPDLILVELQFPDEDAYDICRRIHLCAEQFIPLIVATRLDDAETRVTAFNSGADEFIAIPIDVPVTCARIRSMLRLKTALDSLSESRRQLDEVNTRLEELVVQDPLTGLYNHRHMHELLDAEVERARRYGHPLTCMMADLDNFAELNNQYGHMFGDTVLKDVAGLIAEQSRSTDLVCRYGGDEFLVILPHADSRAARDLGERLASALSDMSYEMARHTIQVTGSFGVAALGPKGTKAELIHRADCALYGAKRKGRNCICFWEEVRDNPMPLIGDLHRPQEKAKQSS